MSLAFFLIVQKEETKAWRWMMELKPREKRHAAAYVTNLIKRLQSKECYRTKFFCHTVIGVADSKW